MPDTYQPLSWNAMVDLLKLVTATDGHPRKDPDVTIWLGVATANRWREDELEPAIVQAASEWGRSSGRRGHMLPGVLNEIVRDRRRQPPAWGQQQTSLPEQGAATAEQRAAAIALFARLMVEKKSVNAALHAPARTPAEAAVKARGRWVPPDWAAVDACGECDAEGMCRDAPGVRCEHPARNRRGGVVASGAHTHHEGAREADDHGDDDGTGPAGTAEAGDLAGGDAARSRDDHAADGGERHG